MKRRISSTLMALVLCLTLLPAAAYADGGTAVYVSSSGNDGTGDGSADKPFATLAKAVDAADDGATVYVMSDLTMTDCARFYSKSLTITSGEGGPYTVTRDNSFTTQSDHARSWYNPAMIEVQTHTGGEGAGLTLTNIIFDDARKHEGTVFAQASSGKSEGDESNKIYVQDAIIASNGNGWADPFATFWVQRNGAAELMIDGLTLDSALPQIVYALVQETGADGKPVSGAEVRVYSTKITDDGIRLTLPNGYTNGCAVALAQPTTDFGSVGISGPTEIAKTSDAAPYEVPYTVTYTMSDSLRGMLNMASADIPAMSFVVELDSRLAAKTGDSGNCLYTFDGDGILDGTASVSGHTVTVTCTPLPGWKAAIAGKSSVKMVLKCAGLLDAAAFAAGESLNTAAHISGKVSSGSTVTSVVIPSSICRTRMTAQTYTVTYHRNGADSGETVDSRSYIFGDLAVVSENGYVRDGHSFVGWNTQRDGSGTHHVPGSSITVTDHIHLYAQWTRNSSGDDDDTGYTLRLTKLDAGDGTPLSGAKFELWRVGTRSDTRLGVYETNRYGWTQAEVSQSGDYYWVETVPPEGYRLGGGKHPTNTGKNSRITVYNTEAAVPALFTDDHYAYIVGGPDGTVRPNDSMTRAGVATIFFRLLKDSVRDANLLTGCTYTDVPDGHWANTAISTMTGLDIVRGYDAAAFGPGDPITRAQFAAICARFDTGKSNGSRTFSDIEGHWAKAYIERAAELGWISGFQDGTFRPDAYITRAQAVTMINRMLNRVPEDPSDLLPGMNVWPDCGPGDWFYLAIQEATNSHDYRRKAGSYETWTDLNANPDWTRYEN